MNNYFQFLGPEQDLSAAYLSSYDVPLVVLSVALAVFASYMALHVTERITYSTTSRGKGLWLSTGALAMGGGVWSMHFIGMIAFNLPCGVSYDPMMTALSMFPGILASAVVLGVISRPNTGTVTIGLGGILMGSGIGAMHYSGMAAMRLDGVIYYSPAIFSISVAFAVLMSMVALFINTRLKGQSAHLPKWALTPIGATFMGIAISGMHYIAMEAAYFLPVSGTSTVNTGISPTLLAIGITMAVSTLISLILAGSVRAQHLETIRHLKDEITARKHAEIELSKKIRELDFQKLTLDKHAIVSVTDVKGSITYVNDKFCEISGYSRDELLGRNHRLVKSEEHPPEFFGDLWRTIANGKTWHGVIKNKAKNGQFYWVSATIVPFLDERGKPFQYVAIRTDITNKVSADNRARIAQRIARFGDWEWNIATGRIIWSDEVFHIFGYEPLSFEPTYEAFLDAIHPDDRKSVQDAVGRSLELREPYWVEHRVIQPDGTLIYVLERGEAQYADDGSPLVMNGTVQDITERVRAEQEMKNSQELLEKQARELRDLAELNAVALERAESAGQAKSEFLANMSHEIRTPMNAIIGLSHLALQTDLDDKQADYIGKVNRSAQGLLGIINDILDFTKIESKKMELENIRFDLAEVLQNLQTLFGTRAEEKCIAFGFSIAPGVQRYLLGDPLRLEQVLINLVGNAVKFTDAGHIEVEVGPTESNSVNNAETVLRFSIHDTGIGLTKAQIDRLFQVFSQADGSTTRKFGGTGLGLMIAKQLVELMDGDIGVDSSPGKGSTFSFSARFGVAEDPSVLMDTDINIVTVAAHTAGGENLLLAGLRILLVEDNEINQQVAVEMLTQAGAQVTVAENGVKAVGEVGDDATRFDVVLMDIQMPEMDGYRATRLLREKHGADALPILAMTAHAFTEERDQCLAAGMQDHVAKPIVRDQLFEALRKWLPSQVRDTGAETAKGPLHDLLVNQADEATRMVLLSDTIEGIDLTEALRRMMGNSTMLIRLLGNFATRYRTAATDIQEFIANDDYTKAAFLVHTLKGAAGNLAAVSLCQNANVLEEACHDHNIDGVNAVIGSFAEELIRVVDGIDGMKAKAGSAAENKNAPVRMDHKLIAEAISHLRDLLLRRNLNAGKAIVELEEALVGHQSVLVSTVRAAVERLDFDGAATALTALEDAIEAVEGDA